MSFPARPLCQHARPEFTRKATPLNLLLVLISGCGSGEVGGVWEITVTIPLFFSTVPSRGRSKPGQERTIRV